MCTVFGLLLLDGVVLIVTDLTFSLFVYPDSYIVPVSFIT